MKPKEAKLKVSFLKTFAVHFLVVITWQNLDFTEPKIYFLELIFTKIVEITVIE